MPCYSPIRGQLITAPDGARRLSFGGISGGKGVSLPCGSCLGCKLERSRQWAVRIMHESKMHEANSFLTLTFDQLPEPCVECAPGVEGSLCVCLLQRFFKRLRSRLAPERIRFFACGEYGERLGRPHYHAIVFGWFPSDSVFLKGSGELSLFSSRLLSDAWGFGFASVGRVSFDSASYVANYATKKISTNREDEKKRLAGRKPEFLVMSRRPGIGRSWIDKFASDVYPSDEVIIRGVQCRPPRYYDQVVEGRGVEAFAPIRAKREEMSSVLESMVLASGAEVFVAPGNNARRLLVRGVVAKAKFALKRRSLGE